MIVAIGVNKRQWIANGSTHFEWRLRTQLRYRVAQVAPFEWRQWMSPLATLAIVIAIGATHKIAIGAIQERYWRQWLLSPNYLTLLLKTTMASPEFTLLSWSNGNFDHRKFEFWPWSWSQFLTIWSLDTRTFTSTSR